MGLRRENNELREHVCRLQAQLAHAQSTTERSNACLAEETKQHQHKIDCLKIHIKLDRQSHDAMVRQWEQERASLTQLGLAMTSVPKSTPATQQQPLAKGHKRKRLPKQQRDALKKSKADGGVH